MVMHTFFVCLSSVYRYYLSMHRAMNFANDSMHTSLCLQFEPLQIATSTVYLAAQFAKIQPVNGNTNWLDALGQPDVETLASISVQIVELIAERKGAEESTFAKVRRDLETLKNNKNANRLSTSTGPDGEPDGKRPRTI